MKMISFIVLSVSIISLAVVSCQKELSFDTLPSTGFILKDLSGGCFPAKSSGKFQASKVLNDSNLLEIQVKIITGGSYNISSDTVNGYSFKASGVFNSPGNYSINLQANGKPVTAGTDYFHIRFDTSVCVIAIQVSNSSSNPLPAVFTLAGTPLQCSPVNISGSYIRNVGLNAADSVTVLLDVISAGSYILKTDTVNGYSFSAEGVLASTGRQTVSLIGSGTPVSGGNNIFTVQGQSKCNYTITVSSPVLTTALDYFPLTFNSYWTYDDLYNTGDTLKRMITDSVAQSGSIYKIMTETDFRGFQKFRRFRKAGSDYLEYGSVDQYTLALVYVPEVDSNLLFLKSNLATGDSWTSSDFVGTLFSGQPVYVRYDYFCIDANTGITVNGNSFSNVYKILMLPQIRSSTSFPYNSTGEIIELYYARGIGLVYIYGSRDGRRIKELKIRNWKVF